MGYANCVLIKIKKDPNLKQSGTGMSCEVALSSSDINRSHAVVPEYQPGAVCICLEHGLKRPRGESLGLSLSWGGDY